MMKLGLLLLLIPGAAISLPLDQAKHLLLRTEFSATPQRIKSLEHASLEKAVDQLLADKKPSTNSIAPDFIRNQSMTRKRWKTLNKQQKKQFRQTQRENDESLKL